MKPATVRKPQPDPEVERMLTDGCVVDPSEVVEDRTLAAENDEEATRG